MTRISKQGFTIIELLMVVGILAVLMGIVTTAASAAIRQARSRRIEACKSVIQTGIATYRAQRDYWPPRNGTLEKWSSEGITGGKHVDFLSVEEYDNMMKELATVSVGRENAMPMMDFSGLIVASKSDADKPTCRGTDFTEAIKKKRKHNAKTLKLAEMSFGYLTKKSGYFRRYIVQYNADSDSVVVMTPTEYNTWWGLTNDGDIKWPSGYEKIYGKKNVEWQ